MSRILLLLGVFLVMAVPVRSADVMTTQTGAASPSPVVAADPDPLDRMLGERQSFDIAFLWFDRLASGELSLVTTEEPGRYRAVLEAKTLGLAAWLTRDRLQRYESQLRRGEDGRLLTISHSSTIFKGKGKKRRGRTKTYTFNYVDRLVEVSVERNGEISSGESLPMAEGEQPQDILAAFYNFRAGYYGPLRPGRNVRIPTFTRKGPSEILIDVLTRSEWPKKLKIPEGDVLCRVTLDPEVFKTGGGKVYVWFNADRIPDGGVVEKVLGMGDVRGTRVKGSNNAQ
ncbi:hypothetical protein C2E25_05465 [Geothermobacter hydrogeniphilus]|uniref:DUF3108 domain-containing protein n=1 Tax=Geothermobacter hydrogeniphilus TaxID=1969733 RepID=A0A2K2HC61_9BACT|nr:DUF3108 domain-containing protein [Geothermobacter hydrogeniphilus]PNU20833.1 hypothetical protein C2E25_05465 [Geothermobacter hydrogeniphilus]